MKIACFLRRAGLVLTLLHGLAGAGHGQAGGDLHPAGLDDVLSIEGVGEAAFSPDGEWLAWNIIPPYDELADYSYWMRANGLSGHQLWVMRPGSDEPPRLQPGLDLAATNYLLGFSPDSRFLLVMEHSMGELRLVACRPGRPDCTRFAPMPDIRDRYSTVAWYNERLEWVAGDRFVMPVRPHSMPGSEMRSRAAAGRFLQEQWHRAWTGTGATSSEAVSTGRDRSQDWAEGDLHLFDLTAGRATPLAPGRFAGIRASPDGAQLAGALTGERMRPPADAGPRAAETHPVFDRRYGLRIVETATGSVRALDTPHMVDPHSLVWSPDGGQLAAYGWEEGGRPADGCFHVVDMEDMDAACWPAGDIVLAPNPDAPAKWWPGPARAAFLSGKLAVFGRVAGARRDDWYLLDGRGRTELLSATLPEPSGRLLHAGASGLVVEAGGSAWHLDGQGKARNLVPQAFGGARPLGSRFFSEHAWSNEFRLGSPLVRLTFGDAPAMLVAERDDGQGDAAGILAAAGGSVRVMAVEAAGERVLAVAPAARALVTTRAEGGGAVSLRLTREDGTVRRLASINTHLQQVRHPAIRPVTYEIEDPEGKTGRRRMEDCLVLPPDYREGERYPLLIEIYPVGRPGRCTTLADRPYPSGMRADLWAARGFIHIRPALPLDLARTEDGPLEGLGSLLDQTIDGLAAQGLIDPDRVVLYGSSQGGAASLLAAAQSNRFAAVISMHGWADFFSHYYGARGLMRYHHLDQNGGDNRWRYECRLEGPDHSCPFGMGGPASGAPGLYARLSPVARAGDITAPVMLVHTDFDYFDMSQYDEMFGALYRAGREARYVRYWGEGHGLSSPANIRDLWQRIDRFLAEAGVMGGVPSEVSPGSQP